MGMYTSLKVTCRVKPEFELVIARLMREYDWGKVAEAFPQYPFLRKWAAVGRCNFIPFGALAYVCDGWAIGYSEGGDYEHGIWKFICSLKNYEGEIEEFFRVVLSTIVCEVSECRSRYEESDYDNNYCLRDGQIIMEEP